MKREDVIAFNRRISQSNPSELICVLYDMYFAYEQDALRALQEDQLEEFLDGLRQQSQIVEHLRDILDFTYPMAGNLFALYTFVERSLAKAMYKKSEAEIINARKVMEPLKETFLEVAKADVRKPMMQNTQAVTVGLTYGKSDLTEAVAQDVGNRGYWA